MGQKRIEISDHASSRATLRGATESEIISAIHEGAIINAERGRKAARLKFSFNKLSPVNNRFYSHKIVEAIYAEEVEKFIVVTVKVFYFNEENAS